MVAPADLGPAVAERLLSPVQDVGLCHIAGPESYPPADVADSFSRVLGRPVVLSVIPQEEWREAFLEIGFSNATADSYARMTEVSIDLGFDAMEAPRRGPTSLLGYIQQLVAKTGQQ